jgi:hypothetical protein
MYPWGNFLLTIALLISDWVGTDAGPRIDPEG